jgi:hypothetical protein
MVEAKNAGSEEDILMAQAKNMISQGRYQEVNQMLEPFK